MRLICPSCDTEYEVHEDMIPAEGRDVQCSNCMQTWFQDGPEGAEPEVVAKPVVADIDDVPSWLKDDFQQQLPPAMQFSDYEDEEDDGPSPQPPAAVAAMAAKRKAAKIDADALSIIHDEVSREQTARKAEAGAIETQIDLGIDDTETKNRATAARDRMRAQSGTVEVAEEITEIDADLEAALSDDPAPEPAPKRELLPDIEEINSTLAEAPDHEDDFAQDIGPTPTRNATRRGFRLGFGLMLMIAAALVGLYVYAPAFSKSMPNLAVYLDSYVASCDAIRVWLDGSAQDLADQITKLLGTVN